MIRSPGEYVHLFRKLGMLTLLCGVLCRPLYGQKINFGAYTTSQGLRLTTSGGLNFDSKQSGILINSGEEITISLQDNQCAYVQIDGDATRDISILVPATTYLVHGTYELPFTCKLAYSNTGTTDVNAAKLAAVEMPAGVTTMTIPMLQRTVGAPNPPPTPAHGGYTAPKATAFLFVYGTLGPVGNVGAGAYSGSVNVYINYTTY